MTPYEGLTPKGEAELILTIHGREEALRRAEHLAICAHGNLAQAFWLRVIFILRETTLH